MELAQLVAPGGRWYTLWLAAHWDRRLKKQDYVEADLQALLRSLQTDGGLVSLRALGHLLLGTCKIFQKKCQLFDDDAKELQSALILAFCSEGEHALRKPLAVEETMDVDVLPQVVPGRMRAVGATLQRSGRRHVARLEDITLRVPAQEKTDPLFKSDLVFSALDSQLESDLRSALLAPPEHPEMQLVPMPASPSQLVPLDGLGPQLDEPVVGLDLADMPLSPRPLDMDIAEVADGPIPDYPVLEDNLELEPLQRSNPVSAVQGPAEPIEEGDGGGAAGHEEPQMKRRRRTAFIFDEVSEIPKETYQGYVNDRSSITKNNTLDYTVFLPHYSSNLPNFATTFTDLGESLCQCLLMGSQVAERRRRLRQEAENQNLRGSTWEPAPNSGPVVDLAFTTLQSPIPSEHAGLASPTAAPMSPVSNQSARSTHGAQLREADLLINAPSSLANVVAAPIDSQDQSESAFVRVGYSARTEKMHKFLAKEFHHGQHDAISYDSLCRNPSSFSSSSSGADRRELVAGCFFELLVLRTNGVIGLQQDTPLSEIRISKGRQFAA